LSCGRGGRIVGVLPIGLHEAKGIVVVDGTTGDVGEDGTGRVVFEIDVERIDHDDEDWWMVG
jgi:hypothetical protein